MNSTRVTPWNEIEWIRDCMKADQGLKTGKMNVASWRSYVGSIMEKAGCFNKSADGQKCKFMFDSRCAELQARESKGELVKDTKVQNVTSSDAVEISPFEAMESLIQQSGIRERQDPEADVPAKGVVSDSKSDSTPPPTPDTKKENEELTDESPEELVW